MKFDREVDASGLNCPLPILRTKKALAEMQSGEILKVISTDSGSVRYFALFAKQTGNALLSQDEQGESFIFFMQRR